jgi:hypothetical protein
VILYAACVGRKPFKSDDPLEILRMHMNAPVPPPEPPQTTREKVEALLKAEKLAEAEKLLLAEQILSPKAGWVHLDLGEVYFRRIWRKDAEREWSAALKMDPDLRHDARLGSRLCTTLGKSWRGGGERLAQQVGAAAVKPLEECAREGGDPDRSRVAARLAERLARRR